MIFFLHLFFECLGKTESRAEEVVVTIEEPVTPPSPEPGDDDWVYVEQPIDEVARLKFFVFLCNENTSFCVMK